MNPKTARAKAIYHVSAVNIACLCFVVKFKGFVFPLRSKRKSYLEVNAYIAIASYLITCPEKSSTKLSVSYGALSNSLAQTKVVHVLVSYGALSNSPDRIMQYIHCQLYSVPYQIHLPRQS